MAKDKHDLSMDHSEEFNDKDLDVSFDPFAQASRTPKNTREAISFAAQDGVRGFKSELFDNKLKTINEIARKALPGDVSSDVSQVENMVSGVKQAFEDNIGGLKKEVGGLAKGLADFMPKNSALEKLFLSIDKKLAGDQEARTAQDKAAEQDREIQEGILSSLGQLAEKSHVDAMAQQAITAKQGATTNVLLQNIYAETHLMRNFTYDIANKFYRKSLELQFRQYFAQKELLEFTKFSMQTMTTQLETIVRNTALPDILKTRSKEFFEAEFKGRIRASLIDNFYKNFNPFDKFAKNAADKMARTLKDFSSGLSQYRGILDVVGDMKGMEEMGMTKAALAGSMIASIPKDFVARKLTPYLEHIPGFKTGALNLKRFVTDPRTLFKSMQGFKKDNWFHKGMRKIGTLGMSLTGGVGSMDIGNFGRQNLDEVRPFDGYAHVTLTKIIPGYLSKIHAELVSVRTKIGGSAPSSKDELVFDHHDDTFQTRSTQIDRGVKRLEERYTTNVRYITNSIRQSLRDLGVNFNSKEMAVLSIALVRYYMRSNANHDAVTVLFEGGIKDELYTAARYVSGGFGNVDIPTRIYNRLLNAAPKAKAKMLSDRYIFDSLSKSLSSLQTAVVNNNKELERLYKTAGGTETMLSIKGKDARGNSFNLYKLDNAGNITANGEDVLNYYTDIFRNTKAAKHEDDDKFFFDQEAIPIEMRTYKNKDTMANSLTKKLGDKVDKFVGDKLGGPLGKVAKILGIPKPPTPEEFGEWLESRPEAIERLIKTYYKGDTAKLKRNMTNLKNFATQYLENWKASFGDDLTDEQKEEYKKLRKKAGRMFLDTLINTSKRAYKDTDFKQMKTDLEAAGKAAYASTKKKAKELKDLTMEELSKGYDMLPKGLRNDLAAFKDYTGKKFDDAKAKLEKQDWYKKAKDKWANLKELSKEDIFNYVKNKSSDLEGFIINKLPDGKLKDKAKSIMNTTRNKISDTVTWAEKKIQQCKDPEERQKLIQSLKEYKDKTGQILQDILDEGIKDGLIVKHEQAIKDFKDKVSGKISNIKDKIMGPSLDPGMIDQGVYGGLKNNLLQRTRIGLQTGGKGYKISSRFPKHIEDQMIERGVAKESIEIIKQEYANIYQGFGQDLAEKYLKNFVESYNKNTAAIGKEPIELDERKVKEKISETGQTGAERASKYIDKAGNIIDRVGQEASELKEASKSPWGMAGYLAKKWKQYGKFFNWKKRPRDITDLEREYSEVYNKEQIESGQAPSFDAWLGQMGYTIKDPKDKDPNLLRRLIRGANKLDRMIGLGFLKWFTGIGLGKGRKGLIRRVLGAPFSIASGVSKSIAKGSMGSIIDALLPPGFSHVFKAPFQVMTTMTEMAGKIFNKQAEENDKSSDDNRANSWKNRLKKVKTFFVGDKQEGKKGILGGIKDWIKENPLKTLGLIGIAAGIFGILKSTGLTLEGIFKGIGNVFEIVGQGFSAVTNAIGGILSFFGAGPEVAKIIGGLATGLLSYMALRHPFKTAGLAWSAGSAMFKGGAWAGKKGIDMFKSMSNAKAKDVANAAAGVGGGGGGGKSKAPSAPDVNAKAGGGKAAPGGSKMPATTPKVNLPDGPKRGGRFMKLIGGAFKGFGAAISTLFLGWSAFSMLDFDSPDGKAKADADEKAKAEEKAKKDAEKIDEKAKNAAKSGKPPTEGEKAVDKIINDLKTAKDPKPINPEATKTGLWNSLKEAWGKLTNFGKQSVGSILTYGRDKIAQIIDDAITAFNAVKKKITTLTNLIKLAFAPESAKTKLTAMFKGSARVLAKVIGGIVKLGARIGGVFTGLLSGGIVSFLMTAWLMWDIAWALALMCCGRSFWGAITEQFFGINLFDDFDPETGQFVANLEQVQLERLIQEAEQEEKLKAKAEQEAKLAANATVIRNRALRNDQDYQKKLKEMQEHNKSFNKNFTKEQRAEWDKKVATLGKELSSAKQTALEKAGATGLDAKGSTSTFSNAPNQSGDSKIIQSDAQLTPEQQKKAATDIKAASSSSTVKQSWFRGINADRFKTLPDFAKRLNYFAALYRQEVMRRNPKASEHDKQVPLTSLDRDIKEGWDIWTGKGKTQKQKNERLGYYLEKVGAYAEGDPIKGEGYFQYPNGSKKYFKVKYPATENVGGVIRNYAWSWMSANKHLLPKADQANLYLAGNKLGSYTVPGTSSHNLGKAADLYPLDMATKIEDKIYVDRSKAASNKDLKRWFNLKDRKERKELVNLYSSGLGNTGTKAKLPVLDRLLEASGLKRVLDPFANPKRADKDSNEIWHIEPNGSTPKEAEIENISGTKEDKEKKPDETQNNLPSLKQDDLAMQPSDYSNLVDEDVDLYDFLSGTRNTKTTDNGAMSTLEQAQTNVTQQQTDAANATAGATISTANNTSTPSTKPTANSTLPATTTSLTKSITGGSGMTSPAGPTAGARSTDSGSAYGSAPMDSIVRTNSILQDQLGVQREILMAIRQMAQMKQAPTATPIGAKELPTPAVDLARAQNFGQNFL